MGKFSKPKAPKESEEVKFMRSQQIEALDKTREEENRRKKAISRNRLGQRQLLSGGPTGILDEEKAASAFAGTTPGRSSSRSMFRAGGVSAARSSGSSAGAKVPRMLN